MESVTSEFNDDLESNKDQSEKNKEQDEQIDETVTQQDLKDYKNKLQQDFLNSENTIKIAKLPSPMPNKSRPLMSMTSSKFTEIEPKIIQAPQMKISMNTENRNVPKDIGNGLGTFKPDSKKIVG